MSTKKPSPSPIPRIPGPVPDEPYQSWIRQFMSDLYQNGIAVTSIASYGWHLHKLGIWLIEHSVYQPAMMSPTLIIEWGGYLRSRYGSQAHKQAAVATKSFFRFLAKIRQCPEATVKDVEALLKIPKTKITIQRTMSQKEIGMLLTACNGETIQDIRNRAILSLLLDTGLRAKELCSITVANIDESNNRIQIIGKGGNLETVYYSKKCQVTLTEWMEARMNVDSECDRLFISLGGTSPGKALTTRGLRIILKRIGEHAGVENVHPHAFRRSFATLRIKNKQSTRGVQLLGRWKNLSTFERYTQALLIDDEFAKNEANSFSPL